MKKVIRVILIVFLAILLLWFYNKPKNIGFKRITWDLLNDTDTIRLINYIIFYEEFAPFGIEEHARINKQHSMLIRI